MEAGLTLAQAYDHGVLLSPTELAFDLEKMRSDFSGAISLAFNVAVEASIILPATANAIITKAVRQAAAVSIEAGFLTKDTTQFIIQRALATVNALSSAISAKNPEILSPKTTNAPQPGGKG